MRKPNVARITESILNGADIRSALANRAPRRPVRESSPANYPPGTEIDYNLGDPHPLSRKGLAFINKGDFSAQAIDRFTNLSKDVAESTEDGLKYLGWLKNPKVTTSVDTGATLDDIVIYPSAGEEDEVQLDNIPKLVVGVSLVAGDIDFNSDSAVKSLCSAALYFDMDTDLGLSFDEEDDPYDLSEEALETARTSLKKADKKLLLGLILMDFTMGEDPVNAYSGNHGGDYVEWDYTSDTVSSCSIDWVREGHL